MDAILNNRPAVRSQGAYVYIIAPEGRRSPVKVGMATDPWERLADLQCGSPVRLRVVEVFGSDDRRESAKLERRFHQAHAAIRLHGEWFDIEDDEANYWLYCETVPA